MTSRTPYIIVRLDAQGKLVMEQTAANGGRRMTPLTNLNQLSIILSAKLQYTPQTIGLDGAPTNAQARHWAKHCGADSHTIVFEDPDCPWCRAARLGLDTSQAAFLAAKKELKRQRALEYQRANPHRMGDGSVTVLKSKSRKINQRKEATPSMDLDFSDLGI